MKSIDSQPRPAFYDYYLILAVPATASSKEIRAAFKRLMLEAHPDKNPHRRTWSERRVRELIAAFDILGNDRRRAEFDSLRAASLASLKRRKPVAKRFAEPYFFRRQDPESRALRVLHHLTHRKPRQAVALLDELESEFGARFLSQHLERQDYLDTLFLLAEHHSSRRRYRQAAVRLREFYRAEEGARYPRPYLPEVVRILKDLYLRKIPGTSENKEALEALLEARGFQLTKSEEGARLAKMVEIHFAVGDFDAARLALAAAEKVCPLSKNLERIRKSIKSAG